MPAAQLNRNLCLPDVHLISLRPEVEGFVVPSKVYSAFAAGRGVLFLGSPGGEIASIIRSSKGGTVISPNNGRALADTLAKLADTPAPAIQWGLNVRSFVMDYASRGAVLSVAGGSCSRS